MGLNALRCHVKIPDRLYFDVADRLGILVWLDMPYMEFLAPATRETLRHVSRNPSPRTDITRPSAFGRSSTRAGASISTTTATIGAG